MIKKILLVNENITGIFIIFSVISILASVCVYGLSHSKMFGNPDQLTLIEISQKMESNKPKKECDVSVGVKLSEANTKGVCL